ncbi:RNA-dependent RNA polymerase [African horse sickness virus 6]|uniref:RNA-directed RNA polymerase n=1 Tax=African horse sickness virus 6 TaxID=86060 RepID=A0A189RMV1_AHSV6|nr:RNA-dependent RNA polymerase [African horse sickness virus 6]
MVITVQGADLVRRALNRLFKYGRIDGTKMYYEYYRYSSKMRETRRKKGTKYKTDDEFLERERDAGRLKLYDLQVIREASWEDLLYENVHTAELDIYVRSILKLEDLEPEEEFLRNYAVYDGVHPLKDFVEMRAKNEMQIFGDMPIKAWISVLMEISRETKHKPLGLMVASDFVGRFGSPFEQNFRDLSQINKYGYCYSSPLLFEMCVTESILEFNMWYRMREERIQSLKFGLEVIDPFKLIREFFEICLPHPKKINNTLRSPYSWFVKNWGIGCPRVKVLTSIGGEDRNSKEVFYTGYHETENLYSEIVQKSKFYRESLKQNMTKTEEAISYSQKLGNHGRTMPIFLKMLKAVYATEFDPTKISHVILASLCLSIQTITGYGRAWVVNKSSDLEAQMKPSSDNYVQRVCDYTKNNFIKAYEEARRGGEEIVMPEDMYTSILRLAKNTSSGFSTSIDVFKRYGPNAKGARGEKIQITSRIKALVIFTKGHEIFTPKNLALKYNTTEFFQTKGSRDVPIKSTRIVYSINLSILVPQLIVTLPLNEYFARAGGSTLPETQRMGGKIIVGDLEATGSRVMDAADTFRNSSDPLNLTIAIDYSEFDTHLTPYNFRNGMLDGIREAMRRYQHLRYEGYTLDELIEFGYGEGRVMNTLWNGKRRVFKVAFEDYVMLSDEDKTQGTFKPPIGVKPVKNIKICEELEKKADGRDLILVSPTDGSDLALINTHLSGENSTLIANSLHNLAIGTVIREEVKRIFGDDISFKSEQYVGDDTLFYTELRTRSVERFDSIVDTIFEVIKKSGHEASMSKTLIAPFSVEKTQTHAKQGIYVPQDRMMLVSSERRKDIEDVAGYLRSQVQTLTTKISRGFSHELAQIIFMMKSSIIGHRKLKRTIKDGGYRDRKYDDDKEDGFTLIMLRDPLIAFYPVEWNGFGAHPAAMNIIMTEDMFVDSVMRGECRAWMEPLVKLIDQSPPLWNETSADKRMIGTDSTMSFFSRMARPAVRTVLTNTEVGDAVRSLPLGDFSPFNISKTMMHSALLKEKNARSLLTPAYEMEYQKELQGWRPRQKKFLVTSNEMEITTNYMKMFNVGKIPLHGLTLKFFPDVNLSKEFFLQKSVLGNRESPRARMSYVDRIDSILRGDVVMRGFITANTIINILEKLGHTHSASDLTTLFEIMNLSSSVAQRLSEYITTERVRFDAMKLSKRGICGDEFSMSLDVCTQTMVDRYIRAPTQFTKTELDAVNLYVAQHIMLDAATGLTPSRYDINVSGDERVRFKQRVARFNTHLPKMRMVKRLIETERLSARLVQNQFV